MRSYHLWTMHCKFRAGSRSRILAVTITVSYCMTLRLCCKRLGAEHLGMNGTFAIPDVFNYIGVKQITFDKAPFDGHAKYSGVKWSDHIWGPT